MLPAGRMACTCLLLLSIDRANKTAVPRLQSGAARRMFKPIRRTGLGLC